MKKFIAVISILLLLFCHFSAVGEGIDLESMSDNELIELEAAIQKELYDRDPFTPGCLYPGTYFVGKDIEAGDFIVQYLSSTQTSCFVFIEDGETEELIKALSLNGDQMYRVELCDGNKVSVSYGVVALIKR